MSKLKIYSEKNQDLKNRYTTDLIKLDECVTNLTESRYVTNLFHTGSE